MNAPLAINNEVSWADLSDPKMRARIDGFVTEHRGSLFHTPNWLEGVERATGHKAAGLVSERLGVINGWLPVTQLRSPLFGKALLSSGFAVGGGVLAPDHGTLDDLARKLTDYAIANGFESAQLRGGAVPDDWGAVSDKHCGFVRDLADDDAAQLLAIPRKSRAEVRKGLKADYDIRIGRSTSDRAAHYTVYAHSVRNLGTPVFPRRLFDQMLGAFAHNSDILTVWKHGEPISSVLSFYHDGAVLPYWGGGTFAARAARSNEVMYYELMRHARRQGMTRFDFGRSKTGSGPYRYKKNWGFEPQALTYATWTAPGAPMRDVDPSSAAYARKIAVWKKLPLWLANRLGPLIARDLA